MKRHTQSGKALSALAAFLTVYLGGPGCAATPRDKDMPVEQQKRLKAMRSKGADASLTIFPVVLWDLDRTKAVGEIGNDIANVVGALLEQAGMGNLEATETAFLLPAEADFDRAPELFGQFVREHPIQTDYALYGEFLGRTGPPRFEEVRTVVVDKSGLLVWSDRQTPDDAAFRRAKPDCPMTCCVFLTSRLREQLNLPENPREDIVEGKFARRAAAKTGLPDEAEQGAMEQRLAVMKKAAATASVAVFPVLHSMDKVSKEYGVQLADALNKKKLCKAQALDSPLRIELERTHNQAKALWDLARAFRDHIRRDPPDADYALYAEYGFSPRDGRAMAVHFLVCDRAGQWVIVDLQNAHHDDFRSIDPQTPDDCARLVAKRLRGYLR